jgi:hypothetical protein
MTVTNRSLLTRRNWLSVLGDRGVLNVYIAAIFTSAFLLFAVQPVFAKMLLPKLGGTSAVWAVSMCFFQAVLLIGYIYAHALDRYVPVRYVPAVHLTLLLSALLALPFGLPAGTTPPEEASYLWLIGTLAIGVGLPFFAVSANAPLLQAWFARTGHPHAGDPYFLYAASNVGSLLALLSYPFVIEPAFGVGTQSRLWTIGFMVLALLIAVAGTIMLLAANSRDEMGPGVAELDEPAPITWQQRGVWVWLAFVPSGLLTAYTTHLSTDIASIPLLWVLPLAAYLATFIVVFRTKSLIPHALIGSMVAPLVLISVFIQPMPGIASSLPGLLLTFVAVVVAMLFNHRELYLRRPEARQLTEFYIWMSAGGVLGGFFCSIVAPQVFNTVVEFYLLLFASLVALRALWQLPRGDAVPPLKAACGLVGLGVVAATIFALLSETKYAVLAIAVPALAMTIVTFRHIHAFTFSALVLIGVVLGYPGAHKPVLTERGFFGVVHVKDADKLRLMIHGTTIHGADTLQPRKLGEPYAGLVYYVPGHAIARSLVAGRSAMATDKVSVGVVGLGVGGMACYAREGETWKYFEIDPLVVKIASDPRYFRHISSCKPADIKLGDARLTLANEGKRAFDYLLIDAFSSDAIPMHLLTREALEMYLDRLTPDGLLVLHVSNRHMDLDRVAFVTSKSIPGTHAAIVRTLIQDNESAPLTIIVTITRSEATHKSVLAEFPDAKTEVQQQIKPWTDDYSDGMSAIWRLATDPR